MAINCAVCGKRQSGWIEDFPLSQDHPGDRICVECNEHLHVLIVTQDSGVIQREALYFERALQGSWASESIQKYFDIFMHLKSHGESGKNLQVAVSHALAQWNVEDTWRFQQAKETMKLTTGDGFDGYRVVQYLDIISEEKFAGMGMAREFKPIPDWIAQFKRQVKESLQQQAFRLGANALIGVALETTLPGGSFLMVSISGTAVIIEKEESLSQPTRGLQASGFPRPE